MRNLNLQWNALKTNLEAAFPLILFYICNLTSGSCTSVRFSSQRQKGYYQPSSSSVYSIHSGAGHWVGQKGTRGSSTLPSPASKPWLLPRAEPWAQLRTWPKRDSSPACSEGHTSIFIDQDNLGILRLAYWISILLKKKKTIFSFFFFAQSLYPHKNKTKQNTLYLELKMEWTESHRAQAPLIMVGKAELVSAPKKWV